MFVYQDKHLLIHLKALKSLDKFIEVLKAKRLKALKTLNFYVDQKRIAHLPKIGGMSSWKVRKDRPIKTCGESQFRRENSN